MRTFRIISLTVLSLVFVSNVAYGSVPVENVEKPPTVLISLLIRNKEHILPYFLTYLQNLSYPKDRIALWFRSDHNIDKSTEIIEVWLKKFEHQYHHVNFTFETTPTSYNKDESSPTDWQDARYNHLIALKEDALLHAKQIWADYLFMLDADALLTYPETLSHLISLRLPIVAPKLMSRNMYSNFWGGMKNYYYQRTADYEKIIRNDITGQFKVPAVYSAVLIDLNYPNTDLLTFDKAKLVNMQLNNILDPTCPLYTGTLEDIIIFAVSANCSSIPIFISNEKMYGYITTPLHSNESIDSDRVQLLNIKTQIIIDHPVGDVLVDDVFSSYLKFPEKHKLTLDHIYMINLERRPERRSRMENLFRELGLSVEHFPAVDGKKLNLEAIKELGIEYLEGYEDPYHRRKIRKGEIGCFLSHYHIWEKMIEKNQKEVLIFEDDIRFQPNFSAETVSVIEQARSIGEYDLIFLGRVNMNVGRAADPKVENTKNLVYVGYSYWALGYVLTLEGAKKLIASEPLKKFLPVDEFLPIMYNRHPYENWSARFSPRNLIAYSAHPLLLFPAQIYGDPGSISDTSNSEIVSEKILKENTDMLNTDAQYISDLGLNLTVEAKTIIEEELYQLKNEISSSIKKHDAVEL